MAADETLDARQMRGPHRRAARCQRALVVLERQDEQIDELATHGRAQFGRHVVDPARNEFEHVAKQAAAAAGGVELHRAKSVRLANASAERRARYFQHPKVRRLIVAENIRLMTALENQPAGTASHVFAALRKEHLRLNGNGDQKMLLALALEVLKQSSVLQRLRGQSRQRHVAKPPFGQLAGELVGVVKC